MSISYKNINMCCKDSNENLNVLYPITKAKNVIYGSNNIDETVQGIESNLEDVIHYEDATDFSEAETPQFQQTIDDVLDGVNELKSDLDDIQSNVVIMKNIADYPNGQINKYYSSKYGDIGSSEGFSIVPRIDLKANTEYTLPYYITDVPFSNFTWIYGVDINTFINSNGLIPDSRGNYTFITTEATSLFVTVENDRLNGCIIVEGSRMPHTFVEYNKTSLEFVGKKNIYDIYVDANYNSNTLGAYFDHFPKLTQAVNSILDSDENNEYNIHINGSIDILGNLGYASYLSNVRVEDGQRQGIVLPDYVNLIGNGMVFLNFLPNDDISTDASVLCVSPINCWKHNRLENISIQTKNSRYAIHCESNNNYSNSHIVLKNCHLRHFGNGAEFSYQSAQAFGCGTGSGAVLEFYNSEFISDKTQGLRIHTNNNQKSNTVIIDGCFCKGATNQEGIGISAYGTNSEPGNIYYKNSISTPVDIGVFLESAASEQTWNLFDYVNKRVIRYNEFN